MVNYYKVIVWVFLSFLLLQNHAGAQNEPFESTVSDKKTETDIVSAASSSFTFIYKKAGSLELDLTVFPANNSQAKSPAIVFFFGGGWKIGSIDQFKPHARYFARRGLTGILVDYRVSSRHDTTPFNAVEDARDAVKFIVQHADEFGIDKNRMVISGGSAGGHLALMSSFVPEYKPAALVLFNPVIDTGPGGYGYKRIGDDYKVISPIDNIPLNPPPMIIFLGTDDKIINVAQAENFCHSVELNRGSCSLKLYQDQKHGFFNYKNTEYFIQTVREADQFLIRHQLLEGEPNVKTWMQRQN